MFAQQRKGPSLLVLAAVAIFASMVFAGTHISSQTAGNLMFHEGDINNGIQNGAIQLRISCERGDTNSTGILVNTPAGVQFDNSAQTLTNFPLSTSGGFFTNMESVGTPTYTGSPPELSIPVTAQFNLGDHFFVNNLFFTGFVPGSGPASMMENVGNGFGNPSPDLVDDKTITVANNPSAFPSATGGITQTLSPGQNGVALNTITIAEASSNPGLWAATGIQIVIPPSVVGVTWHATQTPLYGGTNGAGHVSSIARSTPTSLFITLGSDFLINESLTISNLTFDVASTAPDNTAGFPLYILIGGTNNNQGSDPIKPYHARCCDIAVRGLPTLQSTASQSFTVGDVATGAGTINVKETTGTGKLTSGNTIQLIIPAGLHLQWGSTASIGTSFTGTGAVGVPVVTTISKTNDTLEFPITTTFGSGAQLSITGAMFSNFTAANGPVPLQLQVTPGTLAFTPTDSATRSIGKPLMASATDQDFLISPPGSPTGLMQPITITDDPTTPRLFSGVPIRIRIPPALAMSWNGDPPGTATLTGALAGAAVGYENFASANDTLVITPIHNFSGFGGTGTVGNLNFAGFTAASLPNNLGLFLPTTDTTLTPAPLLDVHSISIGGRPSITSGADQFFTVNDLATPAFTITIVDSPSSPSILKGNKLQIVIPPSLNFTWVNSLTTPMMTGNASGNVSPTVSYSGDSKTLIISVTNNFDNTTPANTLILQNLQFANFSAASAPAGLEVTVTATGPVAATDNFLKGVGAPTLASAQNQGFGVGDPTTVMQTIVVTDDPSVPRLLNGTDIDIWIPTGFNMTWDPAFAPIVTANGAGTLGASSFINGNRTLRIPVTGSFAAAPAQTVTISAGHFMSFSGISAPNTLELFVNKGAPPALPNAFDSKTKLVGIRPTISSVVTADQNGNGSIDHLIVTFNEPIASGASVTTGVGFAAAGYTILGGSVNSNVVSLTLRETGIPDTGATPTLTYNSATGDLADSTYGLGVVSAVPLTQDGAAPVIVGISTVDSDGNGFLNDVVFTFSENLALGTSDINDWKLIDANGTTNLLAGLNNSNISISGNQVIITLSNSTGTSGTPRYQYMNSGIPGDAIRDSSGNLLGTQTNNHPPVANAGASQTLLPSLVTLNGSASFDPDGQSLTYSWMTTGTPPSPVTFIGGNTATPTCVLIAPGVYTFQLSVSDGLATTSATTTVTILNAPPTAIALLNSVVPAAAPSPFIFLIGSLSFDIDGDSPSLTYLWSQVSGPSLVPPANPTSAVTTVDPVTPGVYVYQLAVTDSANNTTTGQITLRVNGASVVPSADAGPNQVRTVGSLVTLNGLLSTSPDLVDPLSYSWTPPVLLTGANTATPTFTPPGPGLYTFQLVVTQSGVASAPSTMTVLAYDPSNLPPVAVANKLTPVDSPVAQQSVTLDATGSLDPEGAPLQYAWTQISGPSAFLSSSSVAQPTFTPVISGTYTFQLTVSDGVQQSFPAQTTFQVLPAAGVGPISVSATITPTPVNGHVSISSAPITLSASAPAPATDFWWEQVSGPASIDTTGGLPFLPLDSPFTFTPPVPGLYRFKLTGLDFADHLFVTTMVDVIVDPASGSAPVANAGSDQTVTAGQQVALDASQTVGVAPVTYLWSQAFGPPVALSDPSSVSPTFTPTVAGTYVFSLQVVSGATGTTPGTGTSPSLVQVVVSPSPASSGTSGGGGGGGGGGGCGCSGIEPLLLMGLLAYRGRRRRRS